MMILSGILNKLFIIQNIKNKIKNQGIEKNFSFSFLDKSNKNKIKMKIGVQNIKIEDDYIP